MSHQRLKKTKISYLLLYQHKNNTGVAAICGATPVFRRYGPILLLVQHLGLLLNEGLHQAGIVPRVFEGVVK